MSVLLLTLLLPIALAQPQLKADDLFAVEVKSKADSEKVDCWKSEKGDFYVFLPAYTDVSTAVFRLKSGNGLHINGKEITDGQSLNDFKFNCKYRLSVKRYGKNMTADLVFMQSENIATMYIQTETGSMDYIHNKKGNNEKGGAEVYTADGALDCKADVESLSGRGNSTWKYDKKAYSLDFLRETNLLNMGAAKRWILLANAEDPSNLRNKIVYEFANTMGLAYSPSSQWVDLYLNGQYAGVYLLCERNEVAENRVNISAKNGTLLSWEDEARLKESGHTYIKTNLGKSYRIHYPKSVSKPLLEEIKNKCQAFENSLFSENDKKWLDMIDLEAWVRKYLLDEMFGNLDGYMLSHYIYYDNSDGKLYAGPVWDYDKTMGNNADKVWSITNPEIFMVGRYKNFKWDKGYISALLGKAEFLNMAKELFKEEFSTGINDFLHVKIPQYIKETQAAFEMNKVRWFADVQVGTLEQEADKICDYITKHNEFLKSAWVDGKQYCKISIEGLHNDMFFTVPVGGTLTEMPKVENTEWGVFDGIYYCDNDEPFDVTKPITEDTQLYGKWIMSSSNKLKDILKIAPIGIIAVLFVIVLVINIKQIRKSR